MRKTENYEFNIPENTDKVDMAPIGETITAIDEKIYEVEGLTKANKTSIQTLAQSTNINFRNQEARINEMDETASQTTLAILSRLSDEKEMIEDLQKKTTYTIKTDTVTDVNVTPSTPVFKGYNPGADKKWSFAFVEFNVGGNVEKSSVQTDGTIRLSILGDLAGTKTILAQKTFTPNFSDREIMAYFEESIATIAIHGKFNNLELKIATYNTTLSDGLITAKIIYVP